MEFVRLLASVALRSAVVILVILVTLAVLVHVLTGLGMDERRAEELGVVLSMMPVVYLIVHATLGAGQGDRTSPPAPTLTRLAPILWSQVANGSHLLDGPK